MAKGNDFKKPVNNQETIIDEDEKNKKLIIIVCLSIMVVLGLIIASITYFNNREIEDDKKNNKGNKPTEVIKKPDVEKPVVDEKPVVNDTTNNYVKPSYPIAVIPPVEEEPEEEVVAPVESETDDYTVTIDENNVVKLTGFSRYVAKVDPTLGNYTNFIRVKLNLDRKYKIDDLDKLTITTKTITGFNNYGVEIIASTPEEIAAGNLYFYWTQAVGDGMPENPTILIDYGDGNSVTYTLDISELVIETPMTKAEADELVKVPTKDEAIGGQDRTYEILVLEPKPSDEINFGNGTVTTSTNDEEVNNDEANVLADPTTPSEGDNSNQVAPEDKNYTLKFTGTANYYDKDVVAGLDLGLEDFNYILSVKVLAPTDITDDEIKNFGLTVTKQDGTIQDLTGAENVVKTYSTGRKFIYLYYAIDDDINARPVFTIDWDGEGTKYGKITYTFDFSELEKAPETENPDNTGTTDPSTPGTPDSGDTGATDPEQAEGTDTTQSESGDVTPEGEANTQTEPEVPSTSSTMDEVNTQTDMVNMDALI